MCLTLLPVVCYSELLLALVPCLFYYTMYSRMKGAQSQWNSRLFVVFSVRHIELSGSTDSTVLWFVIMAIVDSHKKSVNTTSLGYDWTEYLVWKYFWIKSLEIWYHAYMNFIKVERADNVPVMKWVEVNMVSMGSTSKGIKQHCV